MLCLVAAHLSNEFMHLGAMAHACLASLCDQIDQINPGGVLCKFKLVDPEAHMTITVAA